MQDVSTRGSLSTAYRVDKDPRVETSCINSIIIYQLCIAQEFCINTFMGVHMRVMLAHVQGCLACKSDVHLLNYV